METKSVWKIGCSIGVFVVAFLVLFPVFAPLRIHDLGSLKQLTTALLIYADDVDGYHPPDVMRTIGNSADSVKRHQAEILPYHKQPALWLRSTVAQVSPEAARIGMDGRLSAFCTVGDFWFDGKLPNSDQVRTRLDLDFKGPNVPLYRENIWRSPKAEGALTAGHEDGLVVSFTDGHAKFVKLSEFVAKTKVL